MSRFISRGNVNLQSFMLKLGLRPDKVQLFQLIGGVSSNPTVEIRTCNEAINGSLNVDRYILTDSEGREVENGDPNLIRFLNALGLNADKLISVRMSLGKNNEPAKATVEMYLDDVGFADDYGFQVRTVESNV